MGTVGNPCLSKWFGLSFATGKAFPEFAELLGKFGVIQIAKTFARHNHDIPAAHHLLVMTKGFTNLTFDTIALNRKLDALLADHQSDTGMI